MRRRRLPGRRAHLSTPKYGSKLSSSDPRRDYGTFPAVDKRLTQQAQRCAMSEEREQQTSPTPEADAAIAAGVVPEAMQVLLTDEALAQARFMAQQPEHAGKALRFYIEGKGCDGFFYGVAFDGPKAGDLTYEQGDLPVLIDPESFRFMHGS